MPDPNPVTQATVDDYLYHLNHDYSTGFPQSAVPQWGNYVGNGANDAWNKADAALKEWPSLADGRTTPFQHTVEDAQAAAALLARVAKAEADANLGDPAHVGTSNPEDKAAQTHDFELGVASAKHDLGAELAANEHFAVSSLENALNALEHGDIVDFTLDLGAAVFMEVAGDLFAIVSEGWHALTSLFSDQAQVNDVTVDDYDAYASGEYSPDTGMYSSGGYGGYVGGYGGGSGGYTGGGYAGGGYGGGGGGWFDSSF